MNKEIFLQIGMLFNAFLQLDSASSDIHFKMSRTFHIDPQNGALAFLYIVVIVLSICYNAFQVCKAFHLHYVVVVSVVILTITCKAAIPYTYLDFEDFVSACKVGGRTQQWHSNCGAVAI